VVKGRAEGRGEGRGEGSGEARGLPPSSYVVLGLLSFAQPLTGYELRQWALGSTRYFWTAPAMSQIYRELERLVADGLVLVEEAPEGDRARRLHRISTAGEAELRRWVNETPFEPPTIRHPTALRLFLGHLADPPRLRELLEEHRRWAEQVLAEVDRVEAGLAASGDERWRFPLLVAGWGKAFYGGDAAGAAGALAAAEPAQRLSPAVRPPSPPGRSSGGGGSAR
jgi:DNA-binding PadR family transcriptional regulator